MSSYRESMLWRSSFELHAEGRTLIGEALPWEKPTKVRDLTGPSYLEAFRRTAADKTLTEHPGGFPLFRTHEYVFNPTAEPLGIAQFERSEHSLVYRAYMSKTRKADEALALVNDGALRDVSVGFEPLQTQKIRTAQGLVHVRSEIALIELSLAPTGFGQYPEGKVLAVRAMDGQATFGDITSAVSDAIQEALFGSDKAPDGVYLYVCAIGDGWAVYEVEGSTEEDRPQVNDTWRVDYVVGVDGTVTVSDPTRVEQQWVPVESSTRSATPRLDRWRRTSGRVASNNMEGK